MNDSQKDNQYILSKIERIVNAVFILTSVIKDTEDIRHHIRAIALDIMSFSREQLAGNVSPLSLSAHSNVFLTELAEAFDELLSLLSISRNARLISHMNYQVFSVEAKRLFDEIQSVITARVSAAESFFGENTSRPSFRIETETFADQTLLADDSLQPKQNLRQNFDRRISQAPNSKTTRDNHQRETVKQGTSYKGQNFNKGHIKDNSGKHAARREKIVSYIKDKGNVTIGDIVSHLPDIGYKTIQRELNALISEGVLKRSGSRRWTSYHL